ncbi:interferon a3-like [Lepisosteus oculatus]|uniref:interferon a3-like n=1 Tax=Lepisosteus oculatus TaxID=7918 RepID=UPI00371E545B
MALEGSLWLCVVFCLSQAWAMPTRCAFREHLIEVSLNLLKDMGDGFPKECLSDNVVIAFPAEAYEFADDTQKEDFEIAIYKTLNSTDALFENEGRPTSWGQRAVDEFQNLVFRQVQDFNTCVIRSKTTGNSSAAYRITLLKTYFQKMENVLQEKNYSSCAWEIIRKELLGILQVILDKNAEIVVRA